MVFVNYGVGRLSDLICVVDVIVDVKWLGECYYMYVYLECVSVNLGFCFKMVGWYF